MLFADASGKISDTPPQISFLDHGFLFGHSIYEVVRLYDGRFFGWTEHIERLVKSAERLSLPIAPLMGTIRERCVELLKALNEKNAVIRIIVTRGVGKLHIDPRSCGEPQIYLAAWAFDEKVYSVRPKLAVVSIRRNPRVSLDPAIKSGNYLNSVMAFQEASGLGCDDAVLLNPEGCITELTTSNIGWVTKGEIYTPATDVGILHGTTRRFLIENFKVAEGQYSLDTLKSADEIFVLSTLKEVLPAASLRFEDGTERTFSSTPFVDRLRVEFHEKVLERLARETGIFKLD